MADDQPTQEQWLPVVGYEGLYEVSDHGMVRSLDTVKVDSLGRTRRGTGKILSHDTKPNKYIYVNLKDKPRNRRAYVHHLVLEAFIGPRPEGHEACHNNGDRTDNRLANLRWDTVSENRLDIARMGRHNEGSKPRCDNGHPFTDENTTYYGPGNRWRRCRSCLATRQRSKR